MDYTSLLCTQEIGRRISKDKEIHKAPVPYIKPLAVCNLCTPLYISYFSSPLNTYSTSDNINVGETAVTLIV